MDVRIKFLKGKEVKYISHLDLLRTFNRMLIRSNLPICYSQGYNPHIIITFALPLSVGMTSLNEIAQISLRKDMPLEDILKALKNATSPGIEIISVTSELKPEFKEIAKAKYNIKIHCNRKKEELLNVLDSEEILIDKKTKSGIKEINIKPLIFNYDMDLIDEQLVLNLTVAAGSSSNLNPGLIIKSFEKYIEGLEIEYYDIQRECLLTENDIVF